jgi:hypothetical protein
MGPAHFGIIVTATRLTPPATRLTLHLLPIRKENADTTGPWNKVHYKIMLRRTPLKRSSKPIKRTPLKRGGKKKISRFKEDVEFYQSIWERRKHVCYETGEYLGNEARTYMFHHVLEKEKHDQYRHEEWNIVLVSWNTHAQVHSNIDKTPKIKALKAQLLLKIEKAP